MDPLGNIVEVSEPMMIVQNGFIKAQLDADYFIADKVFQRIPTTRRSGSYWTWDSGDWLRSEAKERGPATESEGSGYKTVAGPQYYCRVYAIHKDQDMQTEAEQRTNGIADPRATATRWVTRQLLLKKELLFADTYFNAAAWNFSRIGVASGPTGTQFTRFDAASGSDPIGVIGDAIEDMAAATQLEPNVMVMPRRVKRRLLNNTQIIDRMKAIAPKSGIAVSTDRLLAELFEIDNFIVPKGYYNTAAEGATKSLSPIYGNHILLAHRSGVEDVEEPSAGFIFPWTGYLEGDAGMDGNAVYEIDVPLKKSVRVEGEMAFDMRVASADLGFFLQDVITS